MQSKEEKEKEISNESKVQNKYIIYINIILIFLKYKFSCIYMYMSLH